LLALPVPGDKAAHHAAKAGEALRLRTLPSDGPRRETLLMKPPEVTGPGFGLSTG